MTIDDFLGPLALRTLITTRDNFRPSINLRIQENLSKLPETDRQIILNLQTKNSPKPVTLKDYLLAITDPQTYKPSTQLKEISQLMNINDVNKIDKHALLTDLIYAQRSQQCTVEDIATIIFYYMILSSGKNKQVENLLSFEFIDIFSNNSITTAAAEEIASCKLFNFCSFDTITALKLKPSKLAICNQILKVQIKDSIENQSLEALSRAIGFLVPMRMIQPVSGGYFDCTSPFDTDLKTRAFLGFDITNQLLDGLWQKPVTLALPVIGCYDFDLLEKSLLAEQKLRPVTLTSFLAPTLKVMFTGISVPTLPLHIADIKFDNLAGYKDQKIAHAEVLKPDYLVVALHDFLHLMNETRINALAPLESIKVHDSYIAVFEHNLRLALCVELKLIINSIEADSEQAHLLSTAQNSYYHSLDSSIGYTLTALNENKYFAEAFARRIFTVLDEVILKNQIGYNATSLLEFLEDHAELVKQPLYAQIVRQTRSFDAMLTPIDEHRTPLIWDDLLLSIQSINQYVHCFGVKYNPKEISAQLSPCGLTLVAHHYNKKNDQHCSIYVASSNKHFSAMIKIFENAKIGDKALILFQPSYHDDDFNKQRPRAHRTLVYLEVNSQGLNILHADSTPVPGFELQTTALINAALPKTPRTYYTMQPIISTKHGHPVFLQSDLWNCATHALRIARTIAKNPSFLQDLTIINRSTDTAPNQHVKLIKYQQPMSFARNADTVEARDQFQQMYGADFTSLAERYAKYQKKREYIEKFTAKYMAIAFKMFTTDSVPVLEEKIRGADVKSYKLKPLTSKL